MDPRGELRHDGVIPGYLASAFSTDGTERSADLRSHLHLQPPRKGVLRQPKQAPVVDRHSPDKVRF
jgi:hypothetical protein